MRSVADALRSEERAELARLTATARLRLALALGARDLELFRAAQRLPIEREEAARLLERQRQAARRRSRAMEALIG